MYLDCNVLPPWTRKEKGKGGNMYHILSRTECRRKVAFTSRKARVLPTGAPLCVRACECLCWVCFRLAYCNRFSRLLSLCVFRCVFPFIVWWVRISVHSIHTVVIHSAGKRCDRRQAFAGSTVVLSLSLYDLLHSSVQGPHSPALVSLA